MTNQTISLGNSIIASVDVLLEIKCSGKLTGGRRVVAGTGVVDAVVEGTVETARVVIPM